MTKIISPMNQISSKPTSTTIQSTTILSILPNSTSPKTICECSPNSSLMTTTNSQETKEALPNRLTLVKVWPLTSSTLWLWSKSWLLPTTQEDKTMVKCLNSLSKECSNLTTPTRVTNSRWTHRVISRTCSKVLSLYSSLPNWSQVPPMRIWSRPKCSQCSTPTSNKPPNPISKPNPMLFNQPNNPMLFNRPNNLMLFNPHSLMLSSKHNPKTFSS